MTQLKKDTVSEQVFLQIYTNGQLAHKEMLSITIYYKNVNQNHEIAFTHTKITIIILQIIITNINEDVEKFDPFYSTAEKAEWCSHF